MKSKQQIINTLIALLGALIVFLIIFKTKKYYFTYNNTAQPKLNSEQKLIPTLEVPKLKIFANESMLSKKITEVPTAETSSTNNNQQILTHQYLIKVLSQQQNYLRRCYENHLRQNPTLNNKGTVVVDFLVLPHGEIRDVEIKDSNFNDKIFENCIKTVIQRTQVKKFSGEKFLITFPLEFE